MAPILLCVFGVMFCFHISTSGATCVGNEASCRATQDDDQLGLLQTSSMDASLRKKHPSQTCWIDSNWITIGNTKFSRKDAMKANLGRWGDERGLTNPATIDFKNFGPDGWLDNNVNLAGNITLTSDQVDELTARVNLKASSELDGPMVDIPSKLTNGSNGTHGNQTIDDTPGGADGEIHNNGSYGSGQFKLMLLTFANEIQVIDWINSPNNSQYADHLKVDSTRISTSVLILVDVDSKEHGSGCFSGDLSLDYQGSNGFSIESSSCSETTWSFSQGSIVGYQASIVHWARHNLEKTVAIRLKVDGATR